MCLVSIQYTACGHAGSPFILDTDRCQLWPAPQCVFHFKRPMSYDDLLIRPYVCDQCAVQINQSRNGLGLDTSNDEAKDPEEEQHTDDDTISTRSTRSLSQEPMFFDRLESLNSVEAAVLIEAAAATFPAEKNTRPLRITNASSQASNKSDSGSSDGTVRSFVAPDREKGVFGTTPGIYEHVPGEIDIGPFAFYFENGRASHNSIYDHGDREVEDLIELVLSRWRAGKDSGEAV
ncbi:hypothetical protein PspLS_00756 [Pyricularia sp. CBS 133598]|nr:hypothetical protein PspLS_00756 [Pyricularia sp. CBS 133598]